MRIFLLYGKDLQILGSFYLNFAEVRFRQGSMLKYECLSRRSEGQGLLLRATYDILWYEDHLVAADNDTSDLHMHGYKFREKRKRQIEVRFIFSIVVCNV